MKVFFERHLLHYTIGLTRSLSNLGVSFSIYTIDPRDIRPLMKERFDVNFLPPVDMIPNSRFKWFIQDYFMFPILQNMIKNTDIIHFNGFAHKEVFLKQVNKNPIPIVYTIHYANETEPMENLIPSNIVSFRESGKLLLPIISEVSSKVITVSNYGQNVLKEEFDIESDVIYHGIDLNRFNPYISSVNRKILDIENHEKFVLWVSRFGHHPYKDPFTFIRAIPLVLEECPNTKFIMIGKGHLKPYAINLAKKLQLNKHLRFIDRVKKLNHYYAVSDLFVMTSYNDTFGLVVGEAMACGKPVIVSDRGAPKEVVGDAGYTFKYGSHHDLADKIIKLLEDHDLSRILGAKAHKRITENFTWDKAAKKYLEIYKKVLK